MTAVDNDSSKLLYRASPSNESHTKNIEGKKRSQRICRCQVCRNQIIRAPRASDEIHQDKVEGMQRPAGLSSACQAVSPPIQRGSKEADQRTDLYIARSLSTEADSSLAEQVFTHHSDLRSLNEKGGPRHDPSVKGCHTGLHFTGWPTWCNNPSIDRVQAEGLRSARAGDAQGVISLICHVTCYCDGYTYVFGGLTTQGCSGKLWRLALSTVRWELIEPNTTARQELAGGAGAGRSMAPEARFYHSMVAWRKVLVVFGGDGGPGYLSDLWCFDTETAKWTCRGCAEVSERPWPEARAGHSAVVCGDRMLVFGGWRGCHGYCDLWAFDLNTGTWTELSPQYSQPLHTQVELTHVELTHVGLTHVETEREGLLKCENGRSCESPVARQWHVSSVFHGCLYVHGGCGAHGALQHMWRFDLERRTWHHVSTKGSGPLARCRHSAIAIDSRRWLLLGGKDNSGGQHSDLFVFDTLEATWQSIELFAPPPSMTQAWRSQPAFVRILPHLQCQSACFDEANQLIVLTGGSDAAGVAPLSTTVVRRYASAVLLFEEWIVKQPPRRADYRATIDLPQFLNCHPEPFALELLKYL